MSTVTRVAITVSLLVASFAACGGRDASYPDGSDVIAGEGAWCAALAKASGQGDAWSSKSACTGFFPTTSGAYLRSMSTCVSGHAEKEKIDIAGFIQACGEQVVLEVGQKASEDTARAVVDARCARMKRCEKIEDAECRRGFSGLESAQRALLTTAYNAGARARIADCLASSSCTEDEEAARDACYKPEADKMLWLP